MAKWRMRAIMLVSFHGSFIQSIDVAFLFQALHGAKIKISFNIHAGELRHEAVSDVEGILDGLVVWDRDFIQVLGVHSYELWTAFASPVLMYLRITSRVFCRSFKTMAMPVT